MRDFDAALGKMGNGIRRAQAGFTEADEGFRHADTGFIEALEALKAVTLARGTFDDRFTDLHETVARLETLVLAQGEELRAQGVELRALRDRLEKS